MNLNVYQKISILTVCATLLLILVGGLVRATGAGMGCPDWPKCFGQFIPPTHVSELPENYKEVYVKQRVEKNKKIVGYLNSLGFNDLASTIANDSNVTKEEDFNIIKTWTEYINRLIGAIIGVLVLATFLTSLRYWKTKKSIPISSALAVFLTLFQAWLGSIVVSTNLLPGTITIHMVFAMIIVTVLLYSTYQANYKMLHFQIDEKISRQLYRLSVALLVITIAQLILGTQVREAIDTVKLIHLYERAEWLNQSGLIFLIHRSFSWLVLGMGVWIMSVIWKNKIEGKIYKLATINLCMIILQIIVGVALEYLDLAAPLQVMHLVGVAFMICTQFLMILALDQNSTISGEAE